MNWYTTALVQVAIELGARLLKFSSCHIIIVKRICFFTKLWGPWGQSHLFAHLILAKYLTFSRCLADALYRHGWRGERGEWQVLYITTIQQLSLKCPIASLRNGSPVAIWEPYNRNKGQLRRQLSWAMCQASLGFVWGVCFVTEFWEGRHCVFKCWHLFRQTGKHSATLLDWNGNSAPPLTAKTMQLRCKMFQILWRPRQLRLRQCKGTQ